MKFGINQLGRKAPLWLTFISNFSVVFLGAFAVYVMSIPDSYISAENKNFYGATATFLVSLLKGIELLTGKEEKNEQQ